MADHSAERLSRHLLIYKYFLKRIILNINSFQVS